jgi:hypothetical protein
MAMLQGHHLPNPADRCEHRHRAPTFTHGRTSRAGDEAAVTPATLAGQNPTFPAVRASAPVLASLYFDPQEGLIP